ncbi:MAG: hypothetical protein J4G00_11660, partial [Actinomycetia bacterium]|nr:hypothetical protein [Actinomycetes bacterium]
QSELGAPGLPAEFVLSEDSSTADWQLAALSPLGPMDRQQLLTVDNSAQRLDLLVQLLTEAEELIRARIEMG